MKKIVDSNNKFMTNSYHLGHSLLTLVSVDSLEKIEFHGIYYMEIPRRLIGCQISRANREELKKIKIRFPEFSPEIAVLWKINSMKHEYFILGLAIKLHYNDELISSDYLSNREYTN